MSCLAQEGGGGSHTAPKGSFKQIVRAQSWWQQQQQVCFFSGTGSGIYGSVWEQVQCASCAERFCTKLLCIHKE
ncbi:hypothetical protein FKM82_006035 [Ascaphus truei]